MSRKSHGFFVLCVPFLITCILLEFYVLSRFFKLNLFVILMFTFFPLMRSVHYFKVYGNEKVATSIKKLILFNSNICTFILHQQQ